MFHIVPNEFILISALQLRNNEVKPHRIFNIFFDDFIRERNFLKGEFTEEEKLKILIIYF